VRNLAAARHPDMFRVAGLLLLTALVLLMSGCATPENAAPDPLDDRWHGLLDLAFNGDLQDPLVRDPDPDVPVDTALAALAGQVLTGRTGYSDWSVAAPPRPWAVDGRVDDDLVRAAVVSRQRPDDRTLAAFMSQVESGSVQVSDTSLAAIAAMSGGPLGPVARMRLEAAARFGGTLPRRAVADPFSQVLGAHAWALSGDLPADLRTLYLEVGSRATSSTALGAAIQRLGLTTAPAPSGTLQVGPEDDPVVALGMLSLRQPADCTELMRWAPADHDVEALLGQPEAVAPNRLVMMSLGSLALQRCGRPELRAVLERVVSIRLTGDGTGPLAVYRLWGNLEATCVLGQSVPEPIWSRADRLVAASTAAILADPAHRFGVGSVYAVERIPRLRAGCTPGWWSGLPTA